MANINQVRKNTKDSKQNQLRQTKTKYSKQKTKYANRNTKYAKKKPPSMQKNTNYAKKHQVCKKNTKYAKKHQVRINTKYAKKHQLRQKTPTTRKKTPSTLKKYAKIFILSWNNFCRKFRLFLAYFLQKVWWRTWYVCDRHSFGHGFDLKKKQNKLLLQEFTIVINNVTIFTKIQSNLCDCLSSNV